MTIDPRFVERRRAVAETVQGGRLRSLAAWLLVVGAVTGLAWLARSPLLAVDRVEISGVSRSRATAILDALDVEVGRPLLLVRAARAEQALESDVWIAAATVSVELGGTVHVEVDERRPFAWLSVAEGWALVSADATILAVTPESREIPLPTLQMVSHGEPAVDLFVTASLEFLAGLPPTLQDGAEIWKSDGRLWAEVAGHQVELGRPFEPAAKAAAVQALLTHGQADGALLTVVAPNNPAVTDPVAPESQGLVDG